MKILMVSHEYPPIGGGGANACMNLAAQYADKGNIVYIVTALYSDLKKSEVCGNVHIERVESNRKHINHCGFGEMLSYLIHAIPVVERLEEQVHFDVCQIFFAIPSGPVGYILKKKYSLPYVIRFGGGDIPGFQNRFKNIYKLITPFEKIILNNASGLVANSNGLKKLIRNFYKNKEICIITNGVDEKAFSEKNNADTSRTKNTNIFRLLFVSRLIERKGLQNFLPLLKKVQEECNRKIQLDIVGDGPYREHLEMLVADSGINDMVHFYGQKSKKELPQFYGNADAFIFPSLKEGMPNVVLEAMSYGLPIVMTSCEGSEELINGNGYAADVESFPGLLSNICNTNGLQMKLGVRSIELVSEYFSWDTVSDDYLVLMKNIMYKANESEALL